VRVHKLSKVYVTEPWGLKDQPWFHNRIVWLKLEADAAPLVFLRALQDIELGMGRRREGERYGPRIIDVDILLFGDLVIDADELTVPHPRMRERAFVLAPLAELAPGLVFPDGERVEAILAKRSFKISGNVIFENDA